MKVRGVKLSNIVVELATQTLVWIIHLIGDIFSSTVLVDTTLQVSIVRPMMFAALVFRYALPTCTESIQPTRL